MAVKHNPGERLAVVLLGPVEDINARLLASARRLDIRMVVIGDGGPTLDGLLLTGSYVERHSVGTRVPIGDGIVVFDGRT